MIIVLVAVFTIVAVAVAMMAAVAVAVAAVMMATVAALPWLVSVPEMRGLRGFTNPDRFALMTDKDLLGTVTTTATLSEQHCRCRHYDHQRRY